MACCWRVVGFYASTMTCLCSLRFEVWGSSFLFWAKNMHSAHGILSLATVIECIGTCSCLCACGYTEDDCICNHVYCIFVCIELCVHVKCFVCTIHIYIHVCLCEYLMCNYVCVCVDKSKFLERAKMTYTLKCCTPKGYNHVSRGCLPHGGLVVSIWIGGHHPPMEKTIYIIHKNIKTVVPLHSMQLM